MSIEGHLGLSGEFRALGYAVCEKSRTFAKLFHL